MLCLYKLHQSYILDKILKDRRWLSLLEDGRCIIPNTGNWWQFQLIFRIRLLQYIHTKYVIQSSYLEKRLLIVALVTSNSQMSEMVIHRVSKSPVRTSEVKQRQLIYTRRGWNGYGQKQDMTEVASSLKLNNKFKDQQK